MDWGGGVILSEEVGRSLNAVSLVLKLLPCPFTLH